MPGSWTIWPKNGIAARRPIVKFVASNCSAKPTRKTPVVIVVMTWVVSPSSSTSFRPRSTWASERVSEGAKRDKDINGGRGETLLTCSKTGRAPCRERGCDDGWIEGG